MQPRDCWLPADLSLSETRSKHSSSTALLVSLHSSQNWRQPSYHIEVLTRDEPYKRELLLFAGLYGAVSIADEAQVVLVQLVEAYAQALAPHDSLTRVCYMAHPCSKRCWVAASSRRYLLVRSRITNSQDMSVHIFNEHLAHIPQFIGRRCGTCSTAYISLA